MTGVRPSSPASKGLVDNFGGKIGPDLKQDFDTYSSGNEIPFIDDTVNLLDTIWAGDGQQSLYVKCKKAHASPKITSSVLSKSIELADLLVVVNFYRNNNIFYRQGFFSQTKCMKRSRTGYITFELDKVQFNFLSERPRFQLDYKGSDADFDVSESAPSFLNYSLVSDVHRPFFYNPNDMYDYIDERTYDYRFVYGKNPVLPQRRMLTVLKNTVRGRYGEDFSHGDREYNLIDEVYSHAKLPRSSSDNTIADGGQAEFAIVEISVDTDGDIVSRIDDIPYFVNREWQDVPNESDTEIADMLGYAFEGLDEDGLNFAGIGESEE
jgi:hypothetical protein